MRESLEVNSQSPLYSQLADAILNAIKAGEFKSGDKIPSEEELRKMYGLSRVTVRTAIDSLVEKNILIKNREGYVCHSTCFRKQCAGTPGIYRYIFKTWV